MNRLVRWWKFNVVGAMGVVVQLVVLAGFTRVLHGHYLIATALAIEVAVVHNFVWHQRYTWRERCSGGGGWWGRMVRFQLSNGAVSMVGNLVLMRLLVQGMGMKVVVANGLAIVCCSVMNFALGEGWAFA